ncbi:mucin-5AC-like [Harmonia axyridis]|uniref:mucin-5AC-like n=1 Tax=Harmonia axyridis TaxID=115357 RepID=UPI001E274EB2|nr:mucin-5AC-like [Harmonia axyridis]
MTKDRPLSSIGFSFLLICLQCITTIQLVQSQETIKTNLPPVYYQGVQGKPGVDFPILTKIPKTSFSCKDIETGYYADLETNCQVFHICEDGKKTSFLCPNGTIFQQSDLICDWWFKVNCTSSPLLYEESSEQLQEEIIKKKSARRITNKARFNSGNPKKDATTQNKYPINDQLYEEKKSKAHTKPTWSSEKNQQWIIKENNNNLPQEKLNFRTIEKFVSTTTETIETTTRKRNGYRKLIPVRRKKPTAQPKQTTDQFETRHSYTASSNLRNGYSTTEANVMIVTPETTSPASTPYRKRFPYKNSYSSTTEKTTTTSTTTTTRKPEKESFDPEKYVNIFVGTRQKVLRTNNQRLSNNHNFPNNKVHPCKSCHKNKAEKTNDVKTSYLDSDSNILSEDSEETQVPQETASIVENSRYNKLNRQKSKNPTGVYENHKTEYSEIKDPQFYNEKYFNNIVPVTSQYVTTQAFNTGKIFVGSSVGSPIPRNKTTATNWKTLSIDDHNRKTFKLSAIAFNTAQALNPFQNSNNDTFTDFKSSLDNRQVQEISTAALNTAEPFSLVTKPINNETPIEPSTEPYDVAVPNVETNVTSRFNLKQKEENDKDVLKISTISFNTAKAYESLFKEEIKPQAGSVSTAPPLVSEVTPISFNTAQSYESLFREETKTPLSGPERTVSPVIPKVTPISFNTVQAYNSLFNEEIEAPKSDFERTVSPIVPEATPISFNTAQAYNSLFKEENKPPISGFERTVSPIVTEATPVSFNTAQAYNLLIKEENEPSISGFEGTVSHLTSEATPLSFSTVQAYNSLFKEDIKPETISSTSPPSTDTPFTSNRLETPTTTEEPEDDVQLHIRFNGPSSETYPTETTTARAPLKPRPFELLSTQSTSLGFDNEKLEKPEDSLPYPFFKISKASPFSLPETSTQNENDLRLTDSPTTEPTDLYIQQDDIHTEGSLESFRPGLVVPSSVSPQTLHTLATYFESALSNMTSEERQSLNDLDDEGMEEKLKDLLSHMTRQKYNQLFTQMGDQPEEVVELTTEKEVEDAGDAEDPQKVRKLAKLFSQALSEYLHDPANFKNRLIQVRPTEPPNHGSVTNTEKELLSFSEDDSKNTLASLYNSTWSYKALNKSVNIEGDNNYLGSDGEGLSSADSQSFVSQFNSLNYEDRKKVGGDNLPKNHWTSSPHATNLWRTTFAVDPFSLNKDFQVTEAYTTVAQTPETENYSDIEPLSSEDEEEIKYELRVFPKLSSNSSKLQGILIDFMNASTTSEADRLHRILRKLNTTEDEFLNRMKKIEENPLTKRLILLLIHECEGTKNAKEELIPFLNQEKEDVQSSETGSRKDQEDVGDKDQDARALQLLNSLYNIATKFGR